MPCFHEETGLAAQAVLDARDRVERTHGTQAVVALLVLLFMLFFGFIRPGASAFVALPFVQ